MDRAANVIDGMLTVWSNNSTSGASLQKLQRRRASLYRVRNRMERVLNIADRMLEKMQRRFSSRVSMQPMQPWAYGHPQPMQPGPYVYPQPPQATPYPPPQQPGTYYVPSQPQRMEESLVSPPPRPPKESPPEQQRPTAPEAHGTNPAAQQNREAQANERTEQEEMRLFNAQPRRKELIEQAVENPLLEPEDKSQVKQMLWGVFQRLDAWRSLLGNEEVTKKLVVLAGEEWAQAVTEYKAKWESGGTALEEYEKSLVKKLMNELMPEENEPEEPASPS
jgi:hypothetical protein